MWKIFLQVFGVRQMYEAIFKNDAHNIISKRGWEVLSKNKR